MTQALDLDIATLVPLVPLDLPAPLVLLCLWIGLIDMMHQTTQHPKERKEIVVILEFLEPQALAMILTINQLLGD